MDFSVVNIKEENILALRSFLLEGPEAWAPLEDKIQVNDEAAAGYMSLLYGAFYVALRRRFSPTYNVGEIVRLVADIRTKAGDEGLINTLAAETVIRRAIGATPLRETGPDDVRTVLYAQIFITLYLVSEMNFDRAGLEQFIEEVTAYTEQWLAARRAEASTSASS